MAISASRFVDLRSRHISPSLAELTALVNTAMRIEDIGYYPPTWQALQEAISYALSVVRSHAPEQGQILLATQMLTRAMGDLIEWLSIDFAAGEWDEALDFRRASTGTYWGPSGTLLEAAVDEARIQHDPVSGEALGVLIEESRTNLITSSEQVGLLGGADGTSTHETETGVLPPISGVTEVSKVTPTAGRSNFYQYDTNMPGSDGVTPVTRSFFIKPGPGCDRISTSTSRNHGWYSRYDVSTGDVVAGGNAESATVVPVGEGWLRYTVTSLSTARIFLIEGFSSTSDPTAHFYYTGLQAEEGPAATSYIPTIDSPVTRAADEVSIDLSDVFNPDEGTLRITAQVPEGEMVASLGDLEIVSDDDEMKTYVLSYDETISGDALELGKGIFQSLEYFPRVLP